MRSNILGRFLSSPHKSSLLEKGLIEFYSGKTTSYVSYHKRPKKADDIAVQPIALQSGLYSKTAIVMQGPLWEKDDFTYQTIKLYSRLFTGCKLILSTWEFNDPGKAERFEYLGVTILQNRKPSVDIGYQNNNFQIASTIAGIEEAERQGCTHVLKTRTDMRIHSANVIDFLHSLINTFPLDTGEGQVQGTQKQRLAVLNFFTARYVPYNISDIMQFGHIQDMSLYWSGLDTRPKSVDCVNVSEREKALRNRDKYDSRGAENFMALRFLERLGLKPENNLEDYYRILSERFVVVDKEDLDLYWAKHGIDEYMVRKYTHKDRIVNLEQFSFKDWLVLHSLKGRLPEYRDDLLDRYGTDSIV